MLRGGRSNLYRSLAGKQIIRAYFNKSKIVPKPPGTCFLYNQNNKRTKKNNNVGRKNCWAHFLFTFLYLSSFGRGKKAVFPGSQTPCCQYVWTLLLRRNTVFLGQLRVHCNGGWETADGSEIRRQPVEVGSWNPIIYKGFSTIPGGCLGILPSTVLILIRSLKLTASLFLKKQWLGDDLSLFGSLGRFSGAMSYVSFREGNRSLPDFRHKHP